MTRTEVGAILIAAIFGSLWWADREDAQASHRLTVQTLDMAEQCQQATYNALDALLPRIPYADTSGSREDRLDTRGAPIL